MVEQQQKLVLSPYMKIYELLKLPTLKMGFAP